jgi:hypothetical protein
VPSFDPLNVPGASPMLAYTATLGTGLSLTLSAEAPRETLGPTVQGAAFGVAPIPAVNGAVSYGGSTMPDFVANMRLDQAWGSIQLNGAVHQLRANSVPGSNTTITEYGFAVGAGARINVPMFGARDYVFLQGAYMDGALGYIGYNGQVVSSRYISGAYGGSSILTPGGAQDAYYNPTGTGLNTTTAWTIYGGFTHFWTPSLRSNVAAQYMSFNIPNNAVTNAAGAVDYAQLFTEGNLVWSPVQDLDIGVAVQYRRLFNTAIAGNGVNTGVVGDYNRYTGILKIERRF